MPVFNSAGQPIGAGSDLFGKTVMQLGDSNTANDMSSGTNEPNLGYHYVLGKKYGYNYINNGHGGTAWELRDDAEFDGNSGVSKVDRLLASGELPDYLIIALGTNGTVNGESTDTTENTHTLYGAVRYCLHRLKTEAPTLRLGVIIPLNRGQHCGVIDAGQNVRNDIIRQVCREYSVPYADMMYESGITPDMLSDGLHLTNPDVIVEGMPLPRWLYMRKVEQLLLAL